MASVKALYACFQMFSRVSGLEANVEKSSVYFGGVNQQLQLDILDHLGFLKGELPIRYLGVPLSTKRLSLAQCRRQLIKSVLFSIQTFWSQIFTLPKKLIQLVESVCKRFLWTGGVDNSKRALNAWDKVCIPKVAGGLNIMDIQAWNKVAIRKLLWNVCTKKDKLWVKWIHYYYGRRTTLWMSQPKQASWIVQKILKAGKYLEEVGLQEKEFILIRTFSIQRMYRKLRGEFPKCSWRRLICNNYGAPRWVFILYLNLQGRFQTGDRIAKWSQIEDLTCPLCAREPEKAEHLFFKCEMTSQLWERLLEWQGIKKRAQGWSEEV
ncbi:uncharacterized protein LOC142169812 [Nicotiana tabacum]|uniref:Uncharacterized protein LOC142169812 n=1 Tax=Nicotiana tabacum TaxID=4097 RepID=A0AC58SS81_TOBAC